MSQKLIYAIPLALLALVGGVLLPGNTGDDAGIYARIAGPQLPLEQAGTPMDVLSDFTNPPGTDWGVLFSEYARGRDIILADNNYVVAGYGFPSEETVFDYWALLARYDLNGNLLDSGKYDHIDPNVAYSVIQEPVSGNFTVTGWKYTDYYEYRDSWVWMMTVNSTLDKQREATHGSPFHDWGNAIILDDDGYIIGGWEGMSTLVHDGWGYMVRTHANGAVDWEVRQNTDNTTIWLGPEIYSVERTSDGGAILGTENGMVKVNFASPPTFEWRSGEGEYFAAKQTSDGGYIGVGRKEVYSTWKQDDREALLVTKLDNDGNVTWSYNYGNQRPIVGSTDIDDVGYDVIEVADGYVIAGETKSWGYHGNGDLWVSKIDLSGITEWNLVLGGEGFDEGRAIVPAPGVGYTIAGSAYWDNAIRIWTVKVPGGFTRPEASFTFSPPSPLFVEQRVDFDASASYDPDGNLASYLWDFGDGTTGTGVAPSHTYHVPGTYIATLYVIDNDGVIDDYSLSITAKELEMQWEQYYGDVRDYGHDIIPSPDGGYVVVGSNSIVSTPDIWAFKTDSRGNEVWNKTHGTTGQVETAYCVTIAQDGGYIVAGIRYLSESEIWIFKLAEETGEKVWEKSYNYGTENDDPYDIQWDGDGYIITGCATADDPARDHDILLLRIDVNGDEVWHETYPDPGGRQTCGYSVSPTIDGGYIITGGYANNDNYDGPFLTVKVKSDRTEQWRSNTGSDSYKSSGRWIDQTADLGYIAAGTLEGDLALIKYLPDGDVDWTKQWDMGYVFDYGNAAASTADGGYIIVGKILQVVESDNWDDVYIVRTDASGNLLWDWKTDTPDPDKGACGVITHSNGSTVILAARYYCQGSTWLFKLGTNVPPSASFTYSPDNPESGEPVTFDASASFDEDGSIVAWEWDFGNGDTGTGETTFYTFPDNGTYDVTLTVVDDQDGVDNVTQTVSVAEAFIVDFYADPTSGEAPLIVDFYNNVTGGTEPYDFAWDMDNDSVVDSTDHFPTFIYNEPGAYTVSLEVTDAAMQTKTETKTDYIIVYGISAVTPGVTVDDWEITDDPASDPETYDPALIPPEVDLTDARGFCLSASGSDGSYHFRITFTAPIGSDFVLYKLPEWVEVPYTRIDDYTIDVELVIDGGVLDPPFVIAYRVPPVVAMDDAYDMDEDDVLNVPAPGVLDNDIDVNIDTTAILVDDANHGELALSPDGSFTYTPEADYNGTDNFTYKANNGVADSNIATANITIDPVIDVPDTPINIAPSNGATWVSLTPGLEASAFSHPDNDIHIASRWQMTPTPGDYSSPAFDSGTDSSNLTSIAIPGGILDYSTTYYWRVSYQDSLNAWSEWSEETRFLTEPETVLPGDADGDSDVDIFDMTKVARIILELDDPTPGADADQDNDIDIFDMIKIARIILELD